MQNEKPSIRCVVLAAGNAVRFGGDKLSAVVGGRSLLERALDAVPAEDFDAVAVVTQGQRDGSAVVRRYGFTPVINPRPERGISGSVKIGLSAVLGEIPPVGAVSVRNDLPPQPCDAVLFQTADQPLLRRESVRGLLELWRNNPDKIAALSHNGVRGNPCIFPARFFPELLALEGDRGGSAVIRRHPEAVVLLEVAAEELLDADTPSALEEIRRLL